MTTHQLLITTTVPGLVLRCARSSEYDAQSLQNTLEERLRGAQPILSLTLDGGETIRFNTRHALHWRVGEYAPHVDPGFDLPVGIGGPL